jgi:hypothetical protein
MCQRTDNHKRHRTQNNHVGQRQGRHDEPLLSRHRDTPHKPLLATSLPHTRAFVKSREEGILGVGKIVCSDAPLISYRIALPQLTTYGDELGRKILNDKTDRALEIMAGCAPRRL